VTQRKTIILAGIAVLVAGFFAVVVMRDDGAEPSKAIESGGMQAYRDTTLPSSSNTTEMTDPSPARNLSSAERLARLEKIADDFVEKNELLQGHEVTRISGDKISPEMLNAGDLPTRRAAFIELQNQMNLNDNNSNILSMPVEVLQSLNQNMLGNSPEFSDRAAAILHALSLRAGEIRADSSGQGTFAQSRLGQLTTAMSNNVETRDLLIQTLQTDGNPTFQSRAAESLSYAYGYSAEIESALAGILTEELDAELTASVTHALRSIYRPEFSGGVAHTPSQPAIRALTISLGQCNFRNCSAALEIIADNSPEIALTKIVSELAAAEDTEYFSLLALTLSEYESLPAQTLNALERLSASETNLTRKSVIAKLVADRR